jgi:hypothetical protein
MGDLSGKKLPNRRPHYMVTVLYEEPERGYALRLFCGCGIDVRDGRIVEVFVRPGRVHDGASDLPDVRDGLMERLCDDMGRLVSFHLQGGVFAQQLAQRFEGAGNGPGRATYPDKRPDIVLPGLNSPLAAIIQACAIAQEDWSQMHAQLVKDGVVVRA